MLNPIQTDYTCQACGQPFSDLDALHYHIKSHKLNLEKYYVKYYPRRDLFTQQPLHFKSRESYFSNDFITRTNLNKWLAAREEISSELVTDYCKNWMTNRKLAKNLTYSPSQFELKTLIAPSLDYYTELFGDYSEFAESVGLKNRFDYKKAPAFNNLNSKEIIIDTREGKEWAFDSSITTISKKLDFADYAPVDNPFNVYIERKDICDWAGTLSKGFDRFRREMERAKAVNAHIIVMVESKFSDLMAINYLPHTRYIKATSSFLLHRARELLLEFENVQMVAAGNRKESSNLALKIFNCKENPGKFDWQYLVDKNLV